MAAYGTDLTDLALADSDAIETWTELASPYNAGGTPADDDENLIQGINCQSQSTGTKSGLVFSIVHDAGSDISASFVADDVVLLWHFYAVISNLETDANGGRRAVIGSDLSNADAYAVGGSDDPYAASWKNVAVDPTKAADYTIGAGNLGAWRYFGTMPNTLAAISKGTPHATDVIRYGRAEIFCTGTGCNFTGMAQYNDYNDVTNGYNRLGLFQDIGTYLWKGLMSLGQAATSVTFSDSNKTILIDDTPAAYASFNRLVIRNAASSITWNNITISSLGTTSPGEFEMVENGTVNWTKCTFNDWNTFVFLTNATLTEASWNGCGVITHGGALLEACNFAGYEGTVSTGYLLYNIAVDPDGEMDNCNFTKGLAATHAIQFGILTPLTITLRGIDFTGYTATHEQNDSTLLFPDTGANVTWTVNLIGCTGNISYKKTRVGDTVVLVSDPVVTKITVLDNANKLPIQGAAVYVTAGAIGPLTEGTVIIDGETDANGEITDSRTLASNQDIVGVARSGSAAIPYVDGDIVETIDSLKGVSTTVILNTD